VRDLQLLHERDDLVSPLGDVITAPARLGGLTAFGAKVVKECNRLGIVVDLAHASPETVLGALKVATQPILVSHTGLDSRTGSDPRMAKIMKPHLLRLILGAWLNSWQRFQHGVAGFECFGVRR
jgi:membrane dipeptidase